MKGHQIVMGELNGREAAALMLDGRLDDLLVAPDGDAAPAPGAIYRAIADRPLKGQGGMIMKLPAGQSALFRNAKGLRPGEAMLVQVISFPEEDKAATVTDRLVFKGRAAIVTPGAAGINVSRSVRDEEERVRLLAAAHTIAAEESAHGVIVRSEAVNEDEDAISEEIDTLLALTDQVLGDAGHDPELLLDAPSAHDLAWRDWPKAPIAHGFEEHGVLDDIETLTSRQVPLSAGSIFVEPTRALVAVDVNTGGDFSPAAGLKANIDCARALPRQLRLRGLGGQIVIDLAPMPKKERKQFEQALRAAFRKDPIETALVGWTPLGHFELQRKRERMPLGPLFE